MPWMTDDLCLVPPRDRLQGSRKGAGRWIWIFRLLSLQKVDIKVHRGKLHCTDNSLKKNSALVLCHCSCYLASLGILLAAGQKLCRATDT